MNQSDKDLIIKNYKLAVENHIKNNFEIAKNYYYEVLKIAPNHLDANNNLGSIYLTLGDFESAKKHFYKIEEINPNYQDAIYNLALVFQNEGKLNEAINYYDKLIKINPKNEKAHNNIGVIYRILGNLKKAKKSFEDASKINPKFENSLNNLAIVSREMDNIDEAIFYYEKILNINPNHVDALCNYGILLNSLGDYLKAREYCEKAVKINSKYDNGFNKLGTVYKSLGLFEKEKKSYQKAIEINPNNIEAHKNLSDLYITENSFEKATDLSVAAFNLVKKNSKFKNRSILTFRLKHDVEQAIYIKKNIQNLKLSNPSKSSFNKIDEFIEIGNEILNNKENRLKGRILLDQNQISMMLPFYKENYIHKSNKIIKNCINLDKNWKDVEDEYLNNKKQITYIDNFLSEEAASELRQFCLYSKIWTKEYNGKYLGTFSNYGFISPLHIQIAIDLQKYLPRIFGSHKLLKFWGFKYDAKLGKGINIHADFAVHNLNFWITPDEFNNNKHSGGLKVYDIPSPSNWTFRDYNTNSEKIYKFLKENNANCTNIPYKFNRAVLFNSDYFHETDEIDFKDTYEGRRINNTYLFGSRLITKII